MSMRNIYIITAVRSVIVTAKRDYSCH